MSPSLFPYNNDNIENEKDKKKERKCTTLFKIQETCHQVFFLITANDMIENEKDKKKERKCTTLNIRFQKHVTKSFSL